MNKLRKHIQKTESKLQNWYRLINTSNDKRRKDALSDKDIKLLSLKRARDSLTKNIQNTEQQLQTETDLSTKTKLQNALTKERKRLFDIKLLINTAERDVASNENIYPQTNNIVQNTLCTKSSITPDEMQCSPTYHITEIQQSERGISSDSDDDIILVSRDTLTDNIAHKEQEKTIERLQTELETFQHALNTKAMKLYDAEEAIKKLEIEKQQLMQGKESVRAQYNALKAQSTQMINNMKYDVNIERNQRIRWKKEYQQMLAAKDEEIKRITSEKHYVIGNFTESLKQINDLKKMMKDMESNANIEKNEWKANEMAIFEESCQSIRIAKDRERALKRENNDLRNELQMYRKEKQCIAKDELNRVYECAICFVEYRVQDDVFRMDCDHLINRDCALQTFKADIMHNKILPRCPTCLAEKKTTFITEEQLKCVMDIQTLRFYYELSVRLGLQKVNIFHCPTADCPFYAEITNDLERFNCSVCGYAYCTKCKRAYHYGETCDEYKQRKCKEELMSEQQLVDLATEKGWTQCPKCRTYIERSVGCFHMKCGNAQCQTEYCDGCGDVLDAQNWRRHFNPPNKCRLWQNENDLLNQNDDQKQEFEDYFEW